MQRSKENAKNTIWIKQTLRVHLKGNTTNANKIERNKVIVEKKSLKTFFIQWWQKEWTLEYKDLGKCIELLYIWSKNKWYGMNYEGLFDIWCLPILNDLRTASSWYFCQKVIHFGPIGAQASDSKSAVSTNGKAGNWLRPLPPSSSAPLPCQEEVWVSREWWWTGRLCKHFKAINLQVKWKTRT